MTWSDRGQFQEVNIITVPDTRQVGHDACWREGEKKNCRGRHYLGLVEDGGPLRVEPDGHEGRKHLCLFLLQNVRVLGHRDGVEVDDAKEEPGPRGCRVLHLLPLSQGPKVVANVRHTSGLDSREDDRVVGQGAEVDASDDIAAAGIRRRRRRGLLPLVVCP